MSPQPWRALHVVMHGPLQREERLLLDVVAPTAQDLTWYLIRPPRHPHTGESQLKLRFHDITDAHLKTLQAEIEAYQHDTNAHPAESVTERPLAAEDTRFGGPHGLAAALAHFPPATAIALDVMRTTPPTPARLPTAAQLLAAAAQALTPHDPATWLRHYAAAQPTTPIADPHPLQATITDPTPTAAQWHHLMSHTWTHLSTLEADGHLTIPALAVYTNLVQMGQNRLALTPQDNAHLATALAAN